MKLIRQVQQLTSQPSVNTGKGLDEVQERQRRRKISALHEAGKTALWFCDSFHLDLLKITFKGSFNTEIRNVALTDIVCTIILIDEIN